MTDPNQTQSSQGSDGGKCRDCDPDSLDAIKCRAQGLKARAEYNAAHLPDLEKARDDFNGARAAYSKARTDATPLVDQVKSDLKCLLERLECLISEDEQTRREIVGRIKRAFWEVKGRIDDCGGKTGCYLTDDCEFGKVDECHANEAPNRLADITRRTARAEAAFKDLMGIPAAIPGDVTALQKEVADIANGSQGDPPLDVLIALYAAALVARQHAKDIWRGFANVNDFVDCVCHALTCMLRGHTAIGILTGILAVQKCQHDSRDAECERLRKKTADEVVATYLRYEREEQAESAAGADGGSGGGAGAPAAATPSAAGRSGDRASQERQAARERNEREYYAG